MQETAFRNLRRLLDRHFFGALPILVFSVEDMPCPDMDCLSSIIALFSLSTSCENGKTDRKKEQKRPHRVFYRKI